MPARLKRPLVRRTDGQSPFGRRPSATVHMLHNTNDRYQQKNTKKRAKPVHGPPSTSTPPDRKRHPPRQSPMPGRLIKKPGILTNKTIYSTTLVASSPGPPAGAVQRSTALKRKRLRQLPRETNAWNISRSCGPVLPSLDADGVPRHRKGFKPAARNTKTRNALTEDASRLGVGNPMGREKITNTRSGTDGLGHGLFRGRRSPFDPAVNPLPAVFDAPVTDG